MSKRLIEQVSLPMFQDIRRVLASSGYQMRFVRGRYWAWRIGPSMAIYERFEEEKNESTKRFIDVANHDLRGLLAQMTGVRTPVRATPNAKFEDFSARMNRFGKEVREGWKFEFNDEESLRQFLRICDCYSAGGIVAAEAEASKYPRAEAQATARTVSVKARIGQSKYRDNLMAYWDGCAVTGCQVRAALRASHIKPWRISTAIERLDPNNGLILNATLDSLFDAGLISFQDDGSILISKALSTEDLRGLGVSHEMKLRRLNGAHIQYLVFHRARSFP